MVIKMEEKEIVNNEENLEVEVLEDIQDVKEQKKNTFLNEIFEYVKTAVITVVITTIVLQFVQISKVVGDSMLPNYQDGNILLVDKFFYKFQEPEINDIVVVKYNHGGVKEQIIKRVIAVEGDHIEMRDNKIYRNDEVIDESYILENMIGESDFAYDIPEGKVFVLGDNRNISLDSRALGYFDFEDDVVGKVFFRVLK